MVLDAKSGMCRVQGCQDNAGFHEFLHTLIIFAASVLGETPALLRAAKETLNNFREAEIRSLNPQDAFQRLSSGSERR
jgi:hypothetical protein